MRFYFYWSFYSMVMDMRVILGGLCCGDGDGGSVMRAYV